MRNYCCPIISDNMGIQTNFFVDTANNHTKFMKKTIWVPRVVLVLFMLVSSIPFANAQFTAGRLVVVQTSGDSSDLNSPITLVEYTTGGTSGNTLALPSTSGNNPIQILCGSTGSEGLLTTSADGQLLILAGFSSSATTQTVNLANSTAASTSRVVYTVNALNITTQVASSNADFTGNDIRVAVSDGTNFWTGGAASTVAPYDGIDYFPSTSPTSSTNLYPTSTTMPKVYGMRIFNGNLYFSSQKSPYTNQICQLGTGLPTSGNPTVTTLFTVSSPTSPVSQSKATPVDFSIDPTNTYAYVSINYNGKTSVSGIQKWQNISGTWTYQYTLPTSGTALNGYFGLVVDWTTGPNYTMYATRSDAISTTGGANNKIIKVIDMGSAASSTVSTVYTPPNGSYIHGIAFTPFVTGYSLAGATYCQGTTSTPLSVTVASNVSSAVSYQWYSNTTASISGGTLISGATNSTYTPSTTTAGTTYYYCIVQGTACPASSKVSGAIIVNAVPVIGSQSTATATYCTTGTATALSVTATGTGLSYQWYSNTSASNTGGTIISGATSADYTPLITTAGTTYYYCIVTNNSSCSVTSAVSGAIIVSSLPVINSQSTLAANYCQYGTASSISVTATGTGLTYQWYSNASNSNSGGQSISFATSSSYTPLVTTLGSTYYYCVVTNSNNCSVTSSVSGAISVTRCPFNWTGTTNTDMGTSSNWSTFYTPTSSDTVIISSGVSNMPVLSGVLNVANLTINSGATLTLASGSNLNVYSNITNNGTITATSTSTLAMAGTSSQTISGSSSYSIYNLAINNAAGVSITSSLTANGTITIPNGVLTTNGNLTINFDNGGNIAYSATDAGSISGNVTGTRNFTLGSHYISSPFIGTTVNQIAATTPLTHNGTSLLYTKNFANQNWTAVSSNSTSMSSGEGFSLTLFNAEPVNLTGTYTHNATVSGSSYSNATATEYFLVGNPYPSTLDWNSASGWTNTNISSAIYQWNPTTDVVSSYVSGAGVNGGSNLIPAMQAFMVVTTGSGGNSSVNFGPLCRVTSNTSFFRTVNDPSLTLEVENANSQIDQTLIRFSDMASENYDPTVDAVKCMNPSIVPSLYTVSDDNKNLAINTSPMITPGDAIPLNLKVVVGGTYTIQCSQYNVPGYQLVLFDKFNQSQTIIDTTLKYTIQSLSTDSTDRFQLRLASISTITGTQPLVSTSNALHIYSTESGFIVNTNANNSGSSEIMILDAMGRTLKIMNNITLQTGNNFFPLADIASGVYLVRVTNNTGNYVQKISLVK